MFLPGRVGIHEGVYCGRPSDYGNPFYMTAEDVRDEVCDQYQAWFDKKIADKDERFLFDLRKLWRKHQQQGPDLRLLCFCHPKRCHTQTICDFLNKYLSK